MSCTTSGSARALLFNSVSQQAIDEPVEKKFKRLLNSPAATVAEWEGVISEMEKVEMPNGILLEFNFIGMLDDDEFVPVGSAVSLRAFFNGISKSDDIDGICFEGLEFSPEAWCAALEEVANNKRLVNLEVHNCVFTGSEEFVVNEVLIRQLKSQLTALSFIGIAFSSVDAIFLDCLLTDNDTLGNLTLDASEFEDDDVETLAGAIATCRHLRSLELNSTAFSAASAEALAAAAGALPLLETLSLDLLEEGCSLDSWKAVTSSKSLKTLSICYNQEPASGFVESLFSLLPNLKELSLLGTKIDAEAAVSGMLCCATSSAERPKRTVFVDGASVFHQDEGVNDFLTNMNGRDWIEFSFEKASDNSSGTIQLFKPDQTTTHAEVQRKLYLLQQQLEEVSTGNDPAKAPFRLFEEARLAVQEQEIDRAETLTPELYHKARKFESPVLDWTIEARGVLFLAMLKKMRLFRLSEVPADGNCLFHSLRLLLQVYGNEADKCFMASAPEVRKHLVQLMQADYTHLANFVDAEDLDSPADFVGDSAVNWQHYCKRSLKQTTHPGAIELTILAEKLGRMICVFDAEYGLQFFEGMPGTLEELCYGERRHEPTPLYLYRDNNHFTPLIRLGNSRP